jgi:hypothetical protein
MIPLYLRFPNKLVACCMLACWATQGFSLRAAGPEPAVEPFFAVAGEPLGVASLTIPVGVVEKGRLPRVVVSDTEGRVYYPEINLEAVAPPPNAFTGPAPRRIGQGGLVDRLRNAIDNAGQQINPPSVMRIQFLFRGTKPLSVQLAGDLNQSISVTPKPFEAALHRSMIESWWKGYTDEARQHLAAGDYPPGIETYLTAMLASRLDLPSVDLRSKKEIEKTKKLEPQSTIEQLAGTDALRELILREVMQGPDRTNQLTKVAIPPPPKWRDHVIPPVGPDLPIEKIASRVPPECFYLRFGKFSNAIWFQELTQGQGDGIAQMIMKRGVDYAANQRLERMLNTKANALAKLFGDQIISDMAVIGTDLFIQDGPAMGLLFEAANIDLLRRSLHAERVATAKAEAANGVRLETLTIDNTEVSLLSSPDHRVRSFLVSHENYVLVTTCQHLVLRFLAVSRGEASMAVQPIFRFTRTAMPLSNEYDLFAFFSPDFFRTLLSPQYQIELRRRLQAITSLQLVDMASLAATSEGKPIDSIKDLIREKLLPPWFLDTVDGGQPLRSSSGWVDSRRGGRGSFIPIPDMSIEYCSPEEAERYAQQAEFYGKSWPQTDPLVIGLRRFADEDRKDVERIALEAYVAPFGREKYGWLSMFLAPPVQTHIQLPPDDIANIQAHLSGKSLLSRVPTPDHVMFLGIKDMLPPPPDSDRGLLDTLRTLQQTPAYIGAWPLPGYLDRLPFGLGGGPPDAFGFSRLLVGAWRWTAGGFSVLSFDRSILENCMLHLRPIPAKDPAQVRLKISDLENSKVSTWVNTVWYRRGLEASRGNALLLDTIQSQFKVAPEQAKLVAERFIDAKLQCPLGGEYRLPDQPNQTNSAASQASLSFWSSTAWPSANAGGSSIPRTLGLDTNPSAAFPPQEYRAPWLGWLRGVNAHLTQLPQQLILVGEIRLQKLPPKEPVAAPPSGLPPMNFDLFTAPFKFFGNGDEKAKEKSNERRDF